MTTVETPQKQESASAAQAQFKHWSEIDCSICSEPIRQLCTDSPLDINEYTNLNIIVLPCKHYYHYACIFEWLKRHTVCPYCRSETQPQILKKTVCPPVRCRASILRNKDKANRVGTQCECLEYPNNMGFCRKHLPSLDELIKDDEAHSINLGNRKFLTILKYQHLNMLPSDIKKEVLLKALSLVTDVSNAQKSHKELIKEVTKDYI